MENIGNNLNAGISLEDIKKPEFIDGIAGYIKGGIDYYSLLASIRPKTDKPKVELTGYQMASGSAEGLYNASVTIRNGGKLYTGNAQDVQGLVNAALKASLDAIPYNNIRLRKLKFFRHHLKYDNIDSRRVSMH